MSDFPKKRVSEIVSSAKNGDKATRGFIRHSLSDPKIASLSFTPEICGSIVNLSYSGISVDFPKEDIEKIHEYFSLQNDEWSADLKIGHEVLKAKLAPVRQIGRKAAFTFIHDTAETLVYLREVLEPMRIGSTIRPVSGFAGDEWRKMNFRMQGESHSEIELSVDERGQLSKGRVTFSSQGCLNEVTLENQKLDIGTAVIDFASASPNTDPILINKKIVRQSLFILLGFENNIISDQKAEFMDALLEKMNQPELEPKKNPAA
ncbi:hypothetical protein N9D31_00035 [Oligoflexaceae bacterium]|nr:hypothetical protein [Oligoflexaceae bacterium]